MKYCTLEALLLYLKWRVPLSTPTRFSVPLLARNIGSLPKSINLSCIAQIRSRVLIFIIIIKQNKVTIIQDINKQLGYLLIRK